MISPQHIKYQTDQGYSEYIEITRRVGLIAASLMPINMLLIMKSQSLVCLLGEPFRTLTTVGKKTIINQSSPGGFSEEQMNPYHRIVGRVMIILTTIHGSMFLAYFVQNKMISTRLFDIDILFGLTSVAIFFAIGFTSLAWFRQRHYRTYFITHISLAFIIFPTLYFHTPHLRSYIVESTLIYILNRGLRMATTRVLWAEVVPQTNPNLMSISFLASKGGVFPVYPTTSFIYFTPGGSSIIQSLLKSVVSNPFTVTMNSPKGEPRIVVHRRNGNTAAFDTMSKTTKVLVEGPYGYATSYSPSLADHLLDRCDQFFLCAGGVGATFTMPIANALLHSMNGELEGSIRKRFHVIWVVQSLADVYWAFEGFETSGSSRYQLKDFVRVFVTRDIRPEDDEVIFSDSDDEADEAMELQNKEKRVQRTAAVDGLNISKGRPVVGALVDEFFKAISPSETASIITCGPDNLNRSLRKEVGKFVTKGQSVLWHEEKFGR